MASQESEPVKKLVRNRNRKKVTIDSELAEEEHVKARPKAPVDDALEVSEEDADEEIEDLCSQQAIKAKSLAQRMSTGDLNQLPATKAGPKAFKTTANKSSAVTVTGPQKLKPKPGYTIKETTVIEEDDNGYTKVVTKQVYEKMTDEEIKKQEAKSNSNKITAKVLAGSKKTLANEHDDLFDNTRKSKQIKHDLTDLAGPDKKPEVKQKGIMAFLKKKKE